MAVVVLRNKEGTKERSQQLGLAPALASWQRWHVVLKAGKECKPSKELYAKKEEGKGIYKRHSHNLHHLAQTTIICKYNLMAQRLPPTVTFDISMQRKH